LKEKRTIPNNGSLRGGIGKKEASFFTTRQSSLRGFYGRGGRKKEGHLLAWVASKEEGTNKGKE